MSRERGRDRERQRGSRERGARQRTASRQTGSGPSRRRFLLAGAGVATLTSGCLFLSGGGPGPDAVAESFVTEVDDGNFAEAGELIHSDSPISGAGQAAALITSAAGVQETIDAISLSITNNEVVQKNNGDAVLDTTLELDLVVRQPTLDVPFDMRKDDGDWRIWNLDV
jgi:hypothetical protein